MSEPNVYYPLGTVFTTGEGEHPLMIVGYVVTDADTGKMYDYAATAFPEGFGGECLAMVNDGDIHEILCLGYQDAQVILHQSQIHLARELAEMPQEEFTEGFREEDPEKLLQTAEKLEEIMNPSETEA